MESDGESCESPWPWPINSGCSVRANSIAKDAVKASTVEVVLHEPSDEIENASISKETKE